MVMRGDRKELEKNSEAVDSDCWMHTGDIGEIDDGGSVKIVDRKKELIINAQADRQRVRRATNGYAEQIAARYEGSENGRRSLLGLSFVQRICHPMDGSTAMDETSTASKYCMGMVFSSAAAVMCSVPVQPVLIASRPAPSRPAPNES